MMAASAAGGKEAATAPTDGVWWTAAGARPGRRTVTGDAVWPRKPQVLAVGTKATWWVRARPPWFPASARSGIQTRKAPWPAVVVGGTATTFVEAVGCLFGYLVV